MAKKIQALAIIGLVAFTGLLASGTHASLSLFADTLDHPDYVEFLDNADAPTTSTTYVDNATSGTTFSEYAFTNVKAAEDALCTLATGGTITKSEAALGLKFVNVAFEGSLKVKTTFEEAGEVTTYTLTSGVNLNLCGNYISFEALEETTITSISLTYACTHSYSTSHTLIKTNETVLNGTDLDAVYKCEDCDHKEVRMDPTGFNTYRNGAMINPLPSKNSIVITKETVAVGGVNDSYAVTGAANTWDDKIEVEVTSHTNNALARSNVSTYKIKAVAFDIYADSNATAFRIASPLTSGHANNFIDFKGYNYSNTTNRNMKIFNPTTMQYVGAMNPQTWYTVVVEYPDLTSYPTNQYHCIEIAKIAGTFHYANVRYWHELPRSNKPVELVFSTANAHVGTYQLSSTPIGGRADAYEFKGANTYKDQLDVSWTTRTNNASTGVGTWQDIFYMNKFNGVQSYSVDVYLPAGTSLRLQAPVVASGKHLTNLITANGAYGAYGSGAFASTITLKTEAGVAIAQGETVPADTWITVTFDLSGFASAKYEGASYYLNVSLVAPNGAIGVSNLKQNLA